jgi:hypothetical protein
MLSLYASPKVHLIDAFPALPCLASSVLLIFYNLPFRTFGSFGSRIYLLHTVTVFHFIFAPIHSIHGFRLRVHRLLHQSPFHSSLLCAKRQMMISCLLLASTVVVGVNPLRGMLDRHTSTVHYKRMATLPKLHSQVLCGAYYHTL